MRQKAVLNAVIKIVKKTIKLVLVFSEASSQHRKKLDKKYRGQYEWSYSKHTYVLRDTTLDKYEQ